MPFHDPFANDAAPLPGQLITWHAEHFFTDGDDDSEQYLWCLSDTVPGDRQLVWEGSSGRGLVAVVDFGVEARKTVAGRFERWGRITALDPPIPADSLTANLVSAERFTKPGLSALQGSSIRLSKRHAEAIAELAGSPPPANPPQRSPNPRGEAEIAWTGKHGLEPEKIIEDHIAGRRKLWETLGFPEAPRQQQQLASRRRPDLLSPGVVGDVKRRIRANDGPAQIERYVAELEDTRPDDGPWRAVLVHSQPDLDEAARACITASKVDIAVWGLTRDRRGRHTLRKLTDALRLAAVASVTSGPTLRTTVPTPRGRGTQVRAPLLLSRYGEAVAPAVRLVRMRRFFLGRSLAEDAQPDLAPTGETMDLEDSPPPAPSG